MLTSFRHWLDALPVSNPTERRLAGVLQNVLLVWATVAALGIGASTLATLGAPPPTASGPDIGALGALLSIAGLLLILTPIAGLVLLRRGHYSRSLAVTTFGILIAHSIATYLLGITENTVVIVYQLPIALAGLLGGRRLLLAVSGISIGFMILVAALETMTPPMAGFFTHAQAVAMGKPLDLVIERGAIVFTLVFFVAITALVTLLLDNVGNTLRASLNDALAQKSKLESFTVSLEQTIQERTAALESSLNETRTRAAEQERLLAEVEEQRSTIKDLAVPVIPVNAQTLVIPLVGTLNHARLQDLQAQCLEAISRSSARTLVIDITGVPVVDTQVSQGFVSTITSARLLGAEVILVGIRPEVAQTIVGLGVDLQGVRTYSSLQSALEQVGASAARRPPARA
jgi:rsbT co-antagonist protein RsbR